MDISQMAGLTNAGSLDALTGGNGGSSGSIDISQFLGGTSSTSAFDMDTIMGTTTSFDMNSILGDTSTIAGGGTDINSIIEKIMAQIQPMIEGILKSILGGGASGTGGFDMTSILGNSASINAASVGDDTILPTTTPVPIKPKATQPNPSTSTLPQPSTSTVPSANSGGNFSDTTTGGKGSDSSNQRAVEVRDRLMKDYGLTKEQASGIVGNLYHESDGMKSDVNEYSGGGGFGWAQWTGDRRAKMEQFCAEKGLDPKSAEGNYQFLKHELDNVETSTIPAVKNASTAKKAAIAFESNFERAAVPVMEERINWANAIVNM